MLKTKASGDELHYFNPPPEPVQPVPSKYKKPPKAEVADHVPRYLQKKRSGERDASSSTASEPVSDILFCHAANPARGRLPFCGCLLRCPQYLSSSPRGLIALA